MWAQSGVDLIRSTGYEHNMNLSSHPHAVTEECSLSPEPGDRRSMRPAGPAARAPAIGMLLRPPAAGGLPAPPAEGGNNPQSTGPPIRPYPIAPRKTETPPAPRE